jgi:hypothetical protein
MSVRIGLSRQAKEAGILAAINESTRHYKSHHIALHPMNIACDWLVTAG